MKKEKYERMGNKEVTNGKLWAYKENKGFETEENERMADEKSVLHKLREDGEQPSREKGSKSLLKLRKERSAGRTAFRNTEKRSQLSHNLFM